MIEKNRIYNEDCLDVLRRMDDESVDMAITSPPYDNLREYKGYSFNFEEIAKELYRVLKKGGVLIWVVGDSIIKGSETLTSFRQALYFKDAVGFNVNDTMIYEKVGYLPQTGKRYDQVFEYMFCFTKGTPKTFNPLMKKNKNAGRTIHFSNNRDKKTGLGEKKVTVIRECSKLTNVFRYSVGSKSATDKIAFKHPAIFPEKLADDMIRTWTNEGDLVLDPFMGSGTTAKMALLLGRDFVGMEISKDYCDIAERRIAEVEMG